MRNRCGIYARISLDRRDGEGVARQLADCRVLAAERGLEVVGEYVDNDVSAFRAKRRPEWDRLVADLPSLDVLVAYHPDRLYRLTRDLEDLIDALEGSSVQVVTVKAGDMDLATASGRMVARMLGAAGRHESERIGERVTRAKADRAAQGRPPGGGFRAFGWKADKVTLEPREARALRRAAERVAAGASVTGEAQRLNQAGFVTTGGRPWDATSLRRVLTSPRIAGLRAYRGEIVGPAAWKGIVDEELWRRLVVMADGKRRGRYSTRSTLLTALIACPKCGRRLYHNGPAYSCHPGPRAGCGGASIAIHHADHKVIREVDRYLADPRTARWVEEGSTGFDLSAEVTAIEAKQVDLARRWALDEITTDAYDEARKILEQRLAALGDAAPASIGFSVAELREAWATGSVGARRDVITALCVLPFVLSPGRMGDPADRLTVAFRDRT